MPNNESSLRRQTLSKRERLCGRKDIERLFTHGEAFLVYPVKCTYRFREPEEGVPAVRIMVMAAKRNHKRAVVRNLLKRRLRESYRLNKHAICGEFEKEGIGVDIAFSYIAKDKPLDFRTIESAVIRILEKLCRTVSQPSAEE